MIKPKKRKGKKRKVVEPYHPSVLAEKIFKKLLTANEDTADLIDIRSTEQKQWIIYKGLRIMCSNGKYSVQQYYKRTVVEIENKFLLELILKSI